jgi:hypothetical protein
MSTNNAPQRSTWRPTPLHEAFAYTLADAERMSGLSQASLRRRAAEGHLKLLKIGGRRLVSGTSLRHLLKAEVGQ